MESFHNARQAHLSPADILFGILKDSSPNNAMEDSNSHHKGVNKKPMINDIKCYVFGSGHTQKLAKSNFRKALEAFERIYESVIKQDLEENSKQRKFDFHSLLNLIRDYLRKIITQFSSYGVKEKVAIDEIIERTEKSYFAGRLKKQFLSDKNKYKEMDVFQRLNEIEIISLTRLFKQIKIMLLNRKDQFSGRTKEPFHMKRDLVLKMPPGRDIGRSADVEKALEENSANVPQHEKPHHEGRIHGIDEIEKMKGSQNAVKYLPNPRPIENFKEFEAEETRRAKLSRFHKRQEQAIELGNEIIDRILEKYVAKALFVYSSFTPVPHSPMLNPNKKQLTNKEKYLSNSHSGQNSRKQSSSLAPVKNYDIMVKRGSEIMESESKDATSRQTRQQEIIRKKDFTFQNLDFTKERLQKATKIMNSTRVHKRIAPLEKTSGPLYPDGFTTFTNTFQKEGPAKPKQLTPLEQTNAKLTTAAKSEVKKSSHKPKQSSDPFSTPIQTNTLKNKIHITISNPGNEQTPPELIIHGDLLNLNDPAILSPSLSRSNSPHRQSNEKYTKQRPRDDHLFHQAITKEFVDTNRFLIKTLKSHLHCILSPDCLDALATSNPACIPELKSKLSSTLHHFAVSSALQYRQSILSTPHRLYSTMDNRLNRELIGKNYRIRRGDINIDFDRIKRENRK